MIEIKRDVLLVLKGMSKIYQGMIIRDDYIFTKYDANNIEDKAKGVSNIVVEYKLSEGDVKVDGEFGINNINELSAILDTFDKETVDINMEGTTLLIKDGRKKYKYCTQTTDALPKKNPKADELWESGKKTIVIAITDAEREKIIKDLSVLNADTLSLKSSDGKVKLIATDDISGNDTAIDLDSKFVSLAEGDYEFANSNVFNIIIAGNYKLEVREAEYKNKVIKICKLISHDIKGLEYSLVSA